QDYLPVAELIARGFDHDGAVGRQGSTAIELTQDMMAQILGCPPLEEVVALEPVEAVGLADALRQLAEETADGQAEVVTATGVLAAPERHHRRRSLGRCHQDAVGLDLQQSP